MNVLNDCIVPNKSKDGVIHGFGLVNVPLIESQNCTIMPAGYKVTENMFLIIYIMMFGTMSILELNLAYYFIYRAEIPFIE